MSLTTLTINEFELSFSLHLSHLFICHNPLCLSSYIFQSLTIRWGRMKSYTYMYVRYTLPLLFCRCWRLFTIALTKILKSKFTKRKNTFFVYFFLHRKWEKGGWPDHWYLNSCKMNGTDYIISVNGIVSQII